MNTFKKKSLHAAVLAGLGALGVAGTANAVHINPDGLGQVLVYPYYTVRNNFVTAMSIVNTTSLTKVVKVRFLEGKNSREVLDFNLFLSPQDIWTGVILPGSTAPGAVPAIAEGARLETGDNSCVTPSDLFGDSTSTVANPVRTDGVLPINAFKNYQYTGSNADAAAFPTLDRTREGYIEVLELGIVTDATLAGLVKHSQVAGATFGVPANCGAVDAYDAGTALAPNPLPAPATGRLPIGLIAPGGGLTGRAIIVNSDAGANYTTDITALDAWWGQGIAGAPPATLPYSASGLTTPSIANTTGIDTVSNVFVTSTPTVQAAPAGAQSAGVVTATWLTARESVTSVFMRDTIINEFVNDAATLSKTDWVITMPTKRDNQPAIGAGGLPFRPFTQTFSNTGACDAFGIGMWNREEGTLLGQPGTLLPSPRPPTTNAVGNNLCWEANVVSFNVVPAGGPSAVLGSTNTTNLLNGLDVFANSGATTTGAARASLGRRVLNGPNGWAFLSFGVTSLPSQALQSITPQGAGTGTALNGTADPVARTFFGLPVVGAAFSNFSRTGIASNYGGVVPHKFTRNIR